MIIRLLLVLLNVAADNSRKKKRAGARAGSRRGGAIGTGEGSSLMMVKGSTATATSGRVNINDVLNKFHVPKVIIV